MDWGDWVPFLGFQWVYCERDGKVVPRKTDWEREMFCASWFGHALVFHMGDVQLIADDDEGF